MDFNSDTIEPANGKSSANEYPVRSSSTGPPRWGVCLLDSETQAVGLGRHRSATLWRNHMAFSDDRNSRSGTGIRCLPLQPKLRFAIWHFRPKGTPLCQPGPTAQERRNTNVQSPKGAAIKWISIPTPSNPPTGNNPQTNTLFDHHLQGRPVGAFAFWTRKPRPMAWADIDLPRCGEIT